MMISILRIRTLAYSFLVQISLSRSFSLSLCLYIYIYIYISRAYVTIVICYIYVCVHTTCFPKVGQWICCGRVWFDSDGFPQTRSQVATKPDIELVDVLIMICLGWRVCSGCGTTHIRIYKIMKIQNETNISSSF